MNRAVFSGFTFVELLVVVAVALLIAGLALPALKRLREQGVLDAHAARVAALLEEARTQTLGGKDNIIHGVHFEAGSATVFQGGSYTEGAPENSVFEADALIVLGSVPGADVIFEKGTGKTNQQYTITVALAADATASRTIVVYPTGRIQTP